MVMVEMAVIMVVSELVSGESSPGVWAAAFLLCSHMGGLLCTYTERACSGVSSSYKDTRPVGLGPP